MNGLRKKPTGSLQTNAKQHSEFSMKKMLLLLTLLTATVGSIAGCDQTSDKQAQALGRPAKATPAVTLENQALELALSSPEGAAQLAAKSPETVAVAAMQASEKALSEIKSSPESAMLRLNAYVQLASAASAAAPQSQVAKDAAQKATSAKLRATAAIKDAK
ncbi:hypothetical protein PS664_01887 [Pseudomonas fluorescens]|nr:hypothetical protein PS664_01887 [Pseudomonas fluorescens]